MKQGKCHSQVDIDDTQDRSQTGAAILVGGASTRMGTDKALLRLPGGLTMIEAVVSRLVEAGFGAPLLVTNRPDSYAFMGLKMVPDAGEGAGPLGGILAALLHSESERVFVAACDMPFLCPPLVRYIASLGAGSGLVIPLWQDAGGKIQLETLHAVYSRSCIGAIRSRLAEGRLKLADLAGEVPTTYVPEAELRRYDPTLNSFHNVNTPGEYALIVGNESD